MSPEVTSISVEASLDQALQRMFEGNFRRLLVIDGGDAVGIVSMRDLVRALTREQAGESGGPYTSPL